MGVWLTTLHSALSPQAFGQGSLHFWLIQAKWLEHSELLMHSGLQYGGLPIISGKHEHDASSPIARHCAFDPQGEGWQGSEGGDCWITSTWHLTNGSPLYLGGQLQIGLWFLTWQFAFMPHVPGQGSLHFWLLQASFWGHSALVTHSGLQEGGDPIYPGTHEQTAWPLICRHWELDPHGEGWHGFVSIGAKLNSMGKVSETKESGNKHFLYIHW